MKARQILVVESDNFIGALFTHFLSDLGFAVHSTKSAQEAMKFLDKNHCDGVILNVHLTCESGATLLKELCARNLERVCIVMTQIPDLRFAGIPSSEIPSDITFINVNNIENLDEVRWTLLNVFDGKSKNLRRDDLDPARPLAKITQKQIEILSMLSRGFTNAQIANERGSTVKAVEDAVRRASIAVGVNPTASTNMRTLAVSRYLSLTGIKYKN